MANQRKAGVHRVTLTLPEELLRQAEIQARELGVDRLALIRDALAAYLGGPPGAETAAGVSASASAKSTGRPRAKRGAPGPAKAGKPAQAAPPAKAPKSAPANAQGKPAPAARARTARRRA